MKYSIIAIAVVLSGCNGSNTTSNPFTTVQNDSQTITAPTDATGVQTAPQTRQEPQTGVTAPSNQPAPVAGPCIDSEPVGDGYGWNGIESCQLPIITPAPVPTPAPDPEPIPEPEPEPLFDLAELQFTCNNDTGRPYYIDLHQDGSSYTRFTQVDSELDSTWSLEGDMLTVNDLEWLVFYGRDGSIVFSTYGQNCLENGFPAGTETR